MWKIISSSEMFSATVLKIEMQSISNLMFDSTVCVFNLTSLLLIRFRILNCSMSSVDKSAVSQFINMFLNSWSSYLESVIEIKLKSNDSLMRVIDESDYDDAILRNKTMFESLIWKQASSDLGLDVLQFTEWD
jgi:hypothetical protein